MTDPFDLPPPDAPLGPMVVAALNGALTECLYEAWDQLGREGGEAFEERLIKAEAAAVSSVKNAAFDGLPEDVQMRLVDNALLPLRAIFAEIRRPHDAPESPR